MLTPDSIWSNFCLKLSQESFILNRIPALINVVIDVAIVGETTPEFGNSSAVTFIGCSDEI